MALADSVLQELAQLYGISTEYWDWQGQHRDVSTDTVIAVLAAMGVDARSDASRQQAIQDRRDQPWRRMLPACVVMRAGAPGFVNAHVPAGHPAHLRILLEDGRIWLGDQVDNWEPDRPIDGTMLGEATFRLPAELPLGYHTLVCESDDASAQATLIVTPAFLGLPERVGDARIWGYQAQLYSVRSQGSWGIGDLQDLADLAVWSATQQHADYILINPLHAAQPEPPMEPSPYLPCSRRFVNPIYIRPESIPEYAGLDATTRRSIRALRTKLDKALASTDGIDRDACWAAKRAALRLIHDAGLPPARAMAFDAYRRREGDHLRDFAVWTVLCAHFGHDFHTWAAGYRHPSGRSVPGFIAQHGDEIEFVEWQQWIASEQQAGAQEAAREAGMRVGIVTDLAVGVRTDGADPWVLDDIYAPGVLVGAPPDGYNQLGQDWTQPPWLPDRLADVGYAPFRDMVRAALSHAGGLRIDHILGMFRLWWTPVGLTPDHGCYVGYDHEAMIGIIALEAHRAQAMVVGEDLGTVQPWVRDYLAGRGILGTSVLWFEYYDDGTPRRPQQWRELCMASVTTHDLPPSAGYLAFDHVRLRDRLGLLTIPLDEQMAQAEAEQADWMDWLADTGGLVAADECGADDDVEAEVLALHRALTWSPSRVLNVALVDAVGERRTQNQPGTIDEYPDWRVPLAGADGVLLHLEDVYAMARPMRLAAVVNGDEQPSAPWSASA